MADKLEDVWTARDYPVLREIARRVDAGESTRPTEVGGALGFTEDELARSVSALARTGYVVEMGGFSGHGWVHEVTPKAYVVTGLHPSADDAVDRFVEALNQAADQVDDEDDASALRKMARTALSVSTDVVGAVLGAVATRAAGM
ncbi:hypothetical protein [Krasilnikoviella flava]|uniref:Uncharacterized protein n=1 Tax=Krasilnikoviella flava TaxID=526729 RepID=A0A1T5JBG0_9MICO|nr:hypothetical protein [Krasilnikoviella flava]SKC48745.1 hypothetical protein SAMN04324258_1236 [Krasilnikoviella flava]